MLNASQESLHWNTIRGWGAVVVRNNWRVEKGRLVPAAAEAVHRSTWHLTVWNIAQQTAHEELRAMTANDLRHACYIHALGKLKKHKAFTNAEFDRVLAIFAVLIDPDDLDAVMKKHDYEAGGDPGEARRHLHFIRGVPAAYTKSILIAEEKFYGSTHYLSFPLAKLRTLTTTLKNRHAEFHRPVVEACREDRPF